MRMSRRASRAGLAVAVVFAALLPASAQGAVLASWGEPGQVSGHVEGVAVDAQGEVYVADPLSSEIGVFTREGVKLRSWGSPGHGSAAFAGLSGVAIGPDGDVFASDAGYVQRFGRDGTFKARWGGWGDDEGELRIGAGIAVAPDGTVYVADRWNRRVQAFTSAGQFLRVVGGDLRFGDPRGLAFAADGSLLVADAAREKVVRIAAGTGAVTSWHSPNVRGVAAAPDGTVLATDRWGGFVRRTSAGGQLVETIGSGHRGHGHPWHHNPWHDHEPHELPADHLRQPAAVAVDCRGAVYVADESPRRIHVFGPAGLPAPPCLPPPAPAPPAPPPQVEVAAVVVRSPQPRLGVSGVGEPVSGRVLVKKPGDPDFSELRKADDLPVGTTVDVTGGVVRVTFATAPGDAAAYGPTQTAEFWGGRFRLFQSTSGSLVDVILTGNQPDCAIGARSSATKKKGKTKGKGGSRFVWGKGKGKFRTTGNNGAATVRGTYWYTQDRCDGTFFRTREGIVDVRDFGKSANVTVKAGQRYLARVPCASRRNFDIRLQVPPGQRVSEAAVRVNGRRVRVRPGVPPRVRVDLRGRPKQRVRVRIDVRLASGQELSGVREYRTCRSRLSGGRPPRL